MYQNYFFVNDKQYYTGTIFIIKDITKPSEASFICYDTDHAIFIYKIGECTYRAHVKYFNEHFIEVTDKIDPNVRMPVRKRRKEFDVEGMFLGWVWYIFLMLISTIFKGVIGFWILISWVFFGWRSDKIKKEGTYVEW